MKTIRRRVPSIESQANKYRHSDLSHFGQVVQGLVTFVNYDQLLVLFQSVIADLLLMLFI